MYDFENLTQDDIIGMADDVKIATVHEHMLRVDVRDTAKAAEILGDYVSKREKQAARVARQRAAAEAAEPSAPRAIAPASFACCSGHLHHLYHLLKACFNNDCQKIEAVRDLCTKQVAICHCICVASEIRSAPNGWVPSKLPPEDLRNQSGLLFEDL